MSLTHAIVSLTMGADAKFYDLLPVIYVVQTVDLAILVRFAINVWR